MWESGRVRPVCKQREKSMRVKTLSWVFKKEKFKYLKINRLEEGEIVAVQWV